MLPPIYAQNYLRGKGNENNLHHERGKTKGQERTEKKNKYVLWSKDLKGGGGGGGGVSTSRLGFTSLQVGDRTKAGNRV